jgi:hypothetical protein
VRRPFCGICGSTLPDTAALASPAALLQNLEAPPALQAHIFVGSKSPMCEITDQLPQFAQMPPREQLAELLFGSS